MLAACAVSCAAEPPPAPARKALPPGAAASVGGDLVAAGTIARIVSARGVDPARARDLAVKDALFAAAVRADPAHADRIVVAERAILGRTLLERFESQAHAEGPPTDAEIHELSAERWSELDRPPSSRTSHAVILVKRPDQASAARALAEKLAAELRGVTTPNEFIERAQAFSAKPLELRAERLGLVTADGRMWEPGARPGATFPTLDPDYSRAANALVRPGDQSPVVKTAFGYHVILLEERVPEERPSLEARRETLRDDVVARRAKKLLEGVLSGLREKTAVEVVRAADELTGLVSVAP